MLIDRLNETDSPGSLSRHEPGAWMDFSLPLPWGAKRRAAEKEASRLRALAAAMPVESVKAVFSKVTPEQMAEAQKRAMRRLEMARADRLAVRPSHPALRGHRGVELQGSRQRPNHPDARLPHVRLGRGLHRRALAACDRGRRGKRRFSLHAALAGVEGATFPDSWYLSRICEEFPLCAGLRRPAVEHAVMAGARSGGHGSPHLRDRVATVPRPPKK